MEEIVAVPETVALGVLHVAPKDVIQRAASIATELAKIIKAKHLYIDIRDKQHVTVEGWNTLGAMLGVLPVEVPDKTRKIGDAPTVYEAYVDLVRTTDGVKVGGASSICGRDEKRWSTADEYAVRSMAVTRATGKAFRLGFSWIMRLAGYETTPAEEIPDAEVVERPIEKPKAKIARPYTPAQLKERIASVRAEMKPLIMDKGTKVTEKDRNVLAAVFGKVLQDTDRYALSKWLVGEASTKKMSADAVLALSKWLGATSFEAEPEEVVVKEANSALTEALKAHGQQELKGA